MRQIGKSIFEDNININSDFIKRETIRAVIIKEKSVLMLYSKLYDDYTFPGGGLKQHETHLDTLKRELYEELGAEGIKILRPLGYTLEYRYDFNNENDVYLQKSYFYNVEIKNLSNPHYVGREKSQGLVPLYADPKKVIIHNNIINTNRNKGFKTVLIRENLILEYLLKTKTL